MSVELGNWLLPLAVTIIAFGLASICVRSKSPDYLRVLNRLFNALILGLATIASLSVWLAWAIVVR
ncbi:hypothetical protein U8P68_10765 [Rhizobium ruizarguesonis]|jgi:hypothetical protein|uniref:hypothetical protein n=1 Tax=Rhizobium leguminosarum TaxID=384 RepID=UPI00102FAE2E|nr:hypothetical protein [Rhizobium leguminosarum]TBE54447.1 hypothetical protein ELH04_08515 [Rhizobium leguminosarum]WSH59800.1 hypothetical protein U8P68_10765 [Rhizobium ruizarguesonis]